MKNQTEVRVGQAYKPPVVAAVGEGSWRFWDRLTESIGLILAFFFLPVSGLLRMLSSIRQRSRLTQMRDSYTQTRHEIALGSNVPVAFLGVYLKSLHQIQTVYLTTPWSSAEEAELGYQFMLAAQDALLAEARVTASRLGMPTNK